MLGVTIFTGGRSFFNALGVAALRPGLQSPSRVAPILTGVVVPALSRVLADSAAFLSPAQAMPHNYLLQQNSIYICTLRA